MTLNKDKVTTVAGVIGAAFMAAQPVLNGLNAEVTSNDIVKIVMAIAVAVIGYFTGKTPEGKVIPK